MASSFPRRSRCDSWPRRSWKSAVSGPGPTGYNRTGTLDWGSTSWQSTGGANRDRCLRLRRGRWRGRAATRAESEMTAVGQRKLDIATAQAVHGFRELTDIPSVPGNELLLRELIGTPAFQRLREIHFLGAIDYRLIPHPNGKQGATRYSRYEHSLGVMRLAHLYSTSMDIPPAKRRMVCAAALLHDVGHPPLSHSIEPVFKEKLGIDHHQATEEIIRGRVPLGRDVFSTLRRHDVDIEELISVVSGESSRFDGFFHGPINFDTIEGILRSCTYVHRTVLSPGTVTAAAIMRASGKDRDIVDEFWKYKESVYKNVINSEEGILSDFVCQFFLRRDPEHIHLDCYYGTETELFRRLPGLKELLTSPTFRRRVVPMLDGPVYYRSRNYYIDEGGDFFARRDDVRYRHGRTSCTLAVEEMPDLAMTETPSDLQDTLFDEDTL